ncbi:MAG: sporulation initiation factor Spo0A C-terminal domain-containing protein [Ruminococcus sp.]|nr:sporulation initiation factor Spo0A C-terminal domain-containing protein [Ruminococcus sp.]
MENAMYSLIKITEDVGSIVCCTGDIAEIMKFVAKENMPEGIHNASPEFEPYLSDLLAKLGMPASLCGYEYLKAAIKLTLDSPTCLHRHVTSCLYPEIATLSDTNAACVERAIRHAITVLWDRGDSEQLNDIFGNSISAKTGKVTNSEFIARISEMVRHNVTL